MSDNDVNLCKGCGTMKHLDNQGYCGRCNAPQLDEQTIDRILETLMNVKPDGFGNYLDIAKAKAQLSALLIDGKIEALQEVLSYWFDLNTTVPRLQASPPPVKQFIREKIEKLEADKARFFQ